VSDSRLGGDWIHDVDLHEFDRRVLGASHTVPVLVDFWAAWCAPCLVIDPVLRSLVADYGGRVRLARVEVDEGENMKLAGRYQVRGFPTVILFRDGRVVDRFSSARPRPFIEGFLERHGVRRPG